MKIIELCNHYGITKKELIKLSGVPEDIVNMCDYEGLHMISAIYLFRLSLIFGCEDGSGYSLIDENQKLQVIKEIKSNFICELAETEIEDCFNTEYVGDYESIYDFCASNVSKKEYRQNIEYRYPMLFSIMNYCEIQ